MSHLKRKLYIDLSEKMEIIRYSIGICEGFLQTVAYMGQVVSASFVIVKEDLYVTVDRAALSGGHFVRAFARG